MAIQHKKDGYIILEYSNYIKSEDLDKVVFVSGKDFPGWFVQDCLCGREILWNSQVRSMTCICGAEWTLGENDSISCDKWLVGERQSFCRMTPDLHNLFCLILIEDNDYRKAILKDYLLSKYSKLCYNMTDGSGYLVGCRNDT